MPFQSELKLHAPYEPCLAFEIGREGLNVERQKPLPLEYESVRLDCGYRVDIVVEELVLVEVKAIERLEPVHTAQLLSYLKLSRLKVGLLINFNVKWLLDQGIKRVVNGFPDG